MRVYSRAKLIIVFDFVVDEENKNIAQSAIFFGDNENYNTESSDDNSPIIDLFRFRNDAFRTGTYLFVDGTERESILANSDLNNNFSLDGIQNDGNVSSAFKASLEPRENLVSFYCLKSIDIQGTYLFVGEEEYDEIFASDSDQKDKWEKEGLAKNGEDSPEFYVLGSNINGSVAFNRLQNTQNVTFLYASESETQTIESDPNLSGFFSNQGIAFYSL